MAQSTARYRYIVVNFIQIPWHKHPIARLVICSRFSIGYFSRCLLTCYWCPRQLVRFEQKRIVWTLHAWRGMGRIILVIDDISSPSHADTLNIEASNGDISHFYGNDMFYEAFEDDIQLTNIDKAIYSFPILLMQNPERGIYYYM